MQGMQGHKNSNFIHRLPTALKLMVLMLVSFLLFISPYLGLIVFLAAAIFCLYPLASLPFMAALRCLRPVWWLLLALFFVGLFTENWQQGLVVSLRLSTILLLANLVTITTPTAQMMATFERLFVVLKPIGVHPGKIALVLSLTLRFIPVLAQIIAEVREAQAARGLERSLVGIFIPVLIRMLKMGEDVASAIEARGYDG